MVCFLSALCWNGNLKLDNAQSQARLTGKQAEAGIGDEGEVLNADGTAVARNEAETLYEKEREKKRGSSQDAKQNEIVDTKHQKYSYKEMIEDCKLLQKRYGALCYVNTIGQSADKRKIYEIEVGNPNAEKTLIVVGAIHAREYMTAQLCMKQIEYYLSHSQKTLDGVHMSSLLDDIRICYIPMANPDGVSISQSGLGVIRSTKIRKMYKMMSGTANTAIWKANARGVDLNRNFPASYIPHYGGNRGSEGFTGIESASEPETRAIMDYVNRMQETTDLRGVVCYHTAGQIVFGDVPASASKTLRKTIKKMYKQACSLTHYKSAAGYSYKGQKSGVGNMRTWLLSECEIACITLEIGTGASPLSKRQFKAVWSENKYVPIKEAKLLQ